jgi:hypothetical protein
MRFFPQLGSEPAPVPSTDGQRASLSSLLTTVEAAAYLRLSGRTLEDKRVKGTGPKYYKVGPGKQSKVLYRVDDLESWFTEFKFGSTSEYPR